MIIRPETVADYAAVAELTARAFGNRAAEAVIIPLLRQRAAFDPQLSLVAEEDGRVVGHALFSPYRVRLLGADVPAVNLAPLAVAPERQRLGIGGRLLEAGHEAARAKGYVISFLLGHDSYYPRFGYLTEAFGGSALALAGHVTGTPGTGATEQGAGEKLVSRAPLPDDLPALQELWRHEEAAVDMALEPGLALLDWISPNPQVEAQVWLRNDAIVGYTRAHAGQPAEPRVFLAASEQDALALARALSRRAGGAALALPLHPASASAAVLGSPSATAWSAAMVCPLAPSPFDDYYAQLRAGLRPPGRVTWPVAFDLA